MTTSELATVVKETLMSKPNKGVQFKSFANAMGDDFIPFVEWCNKSVKDAKLKQIADLEEKLRILKGLPKPEKKK